MASATRSGRIYATVESISGGEMETSPAKKKSRKNVVTPEKLEPIPFTAFITPIKQAALSVSESDHDPEFTRSDMFEYDISSEPLNLETVVLSSPASIFKYDTPSDTESEISVGFGGWLTNERKHPVDSDNKENFPPDSSTTVTPLPLISFLQNTVPPTTIPRYPLVPRNSYGGIRACLPPEQLAGWLHRTANSASVAPAVPDPVVSQQGTFTAEQLARIELNRAAALEKLRANATK